MNKQSLTSPDMTIIAQEARKLQPWIIERRRYLHEHPEVSYREKQTADFLRAQLAEIGLHPSDPVCEGRHGFYTEIHSPHNPGRFIVLRADMDALPIQEENIVDYRSTVDGVGHLCGHDVHMAMLLGAVRILRDRQEELPISVRCFFQHAEEIPPGGAQDFVKAGLLKDVVGVFGVHISPRLPSGTIGVREGETMAGAAAFEAVIRGEGGHGGAPHENRDPMTATANVIMSLQQIVSRRLNPTEPGVVSVCKIRGGDAHNVIPSEVRIAGTVRSFNPERLTEMCRWTREIIESAARTWNCEAEVLIDEGYPPVINDVKAIELVGKCCKELFGPEVLRISPLTMGGEDFAYYLRERPGAFFFLGIHKPGEAKHSLHHPQFLPDESVIWMGSALMASLPYRILDVLPE